MSVTPVDSAFDLLLKVPFRGIPIAQLSCHSKLTAPHPSPCRLIEEGKQHASWIHLVKSKSRGGLGWEGIQRVIHLLAGHPAY